MIDRKLKHTWLLLIVVVQMAMLDAYAEQRAIKAKTATRVISAGGSITEIMYALGLGERLVAVDSSSYYPLQATQLPKVGYFRSLAAEGVLSLKPDLLVAARGAGPDVVLQQVQALGVDVKTYEQSNYSLESWKTLVMDIGVDFDRSGAATELVKTVTQKIAHHQGERDFNERSINAVALLSIGQRGPVAAGKNTVPDLLMQLAGINNVASSLEGYKPFSTELLAEKKVDLVLIPSHVVEGLGGEDAICENQVLDMATDGECGLFVMDGLLLMGFGARLDQAVAQLVRFGNGV